MPDVAVIQADDCKFRQTATPEMKERYAGMVQTVWSPASSFLKKYYDENNSNAVAYNTPMNCFRILYNT